MEEQKGQVYADKCVTLVWRLLRSSEQYYAGNHVIYGSADRNLERIRRFIREFIVFRAKIARWPAFNSSQWMLPPTRGKSPI